MKTMKFLSICIAIALLASLSACGGTAPADRVVSALPGDQAILETVNGTKVPVILLTKLAAARKLDLDKSDEYAAALKELNDYVLLGQEADRAGYWKDVNFAADVEIARMQAVANRSVLDMREQTRIDDSLLKAEYDQQVAKLGTHEYDISQMIFKTEDQALNAANELAAGKSWQSVFDTLGKTAEQAKAYSGVKLAQLPEPLAAAVRNTPVGQSMKVPVQTQYGWHLIHVDLATPFKPASFEEMKEGIRLTLAGQLATDRLQKLRDEAKIELLQSAPAEPAGKPGTPTTPAAAPAAEPKQG